MKMMAESSRLRISCCRKSRVKRGIEYEETLIQFNCITCLRSVVVLDVHTNIEEFSQRIEIHIEWLECIMFGLA